MNIDIRKDKTKKQREQFKNAAQELSERARNGEKNLFIKLINNIPAVITDLNNNDSTKNDINGTHQVANSKNSFNPSNDAKNSPTTKRKAEESINIDTDDSSTNINDKAKKLRNTDNPKN